MHVMSEGTHCSKMWLLPNRTVNTRCLLIIYRLCFNLSISTYFLTTVWIEVCSASLIYIEVAYFSAADYLYLRLYWAGQTSLFEESPQTSLMFVQIKYADICKVLHELEHFLAVACIAFCIVFLIINNFGHCYQSKSLISCISCCRFYCRIVLCHFCECLNIANKNKLVTVRT